MKKNIIWLVCLSLVYIPILLFDLFVAIVGNMATPCSFIDFKCLINHNSYDGIFINITGLLVIFAINLLVLIPIFINAKKIIHEIRKPSSDGGTK